MTELINAAQEARERAYAPYSGYKVGAAIRSNSGKTWTGCNIENVVYGETMCAERTALFKMVSEEGTHVAEVAVATKDGGTPCGSCLQVLFEFAPQPENVPVHTVDESGGVRTFMLRDLMPHAFQSQEVDRTER